LVAVTGIEPVTYGL